MATDFARLFDYQRCQEILASKEAAATKEQLIADECSSNEFIYLDYWACYAEVFHASNPEGTISCVDLIPEMLEENFILLNAQHIDEMLVSLQEHRDELTVMTKDSIDKLATWRDICQKNQRYLVAYHFD